MNILEMGPHMYDYVCIYVWIFPQFDGSIACHKMLTIPLQRFNIIAIPITIFFINQLILKLSLYEIDLNETTEYAIHNMDVLKIIN